MQSFKLIAQTLGECIVSRLDVRMDVLSALRKVLLHCFAGQCLAFIVKIKIIIQKTVNILTGNHCFLRARITLV